MIKNVILLFLLYSNLYGFIGKLTEVTGPTQVSRTSTKIEGKVDVGVEMNDTIETLKGRAGITFEDGTKVQCTEFSKLVIDEFVYDPNSGKGKLGLKASMGTVRYASGLIAKNSKEEVKIKTPTASISVRGTDFSMTVDEMGRSLVILLPSVRENEKFIGSIEVTNGLGTVVLTQAYQATMVSSITTIPSMPVLLNFEDESRINNMILIDTPRHVVEAAKETKKTAVQKTEDDSGSKKSKVETKTETKSTTSVTQAQVTAVTTQTQDVQKEEKQTTLDINKLDAEVGKKIIETLDSKPTTTAVVTPTSVPVVIPTATVNNGFTTDGVRAILYISNGNNVIYYTLKADTNASFKMV